MLHSTLKITAYYYWSVAYHEIEGRLSFQQKKATIFQCQQGSEDGLSGQRKKICSGEKVQSTADQFKASVILTETDVMGRLNQLMGSKRPLINHTQINEFTAQ